MRGSRLVWLPCLALLGTLNSSRRGVPCFVRERLRGTPTPRKRQGGAKSKANNARIWTSRIKKAETAAELLRVLDGAVDGEIFDHIHASAACTSLAAFNGKGELQAADAKNPVIQKLAGRIEVLIKANKVGPRELANVLWAFAKMFLSVPAVLVAMPALVRGVAAKAKGMNAQDLSNSLWAAAHLQDACPKVVEIVPALVAQIPSQAGDMDAQALSNIMLAAAKLQDVAPEVLQVVPAVVAEIPRRARNMKPQEVSNCLFAAMRLADAVPEVVEAVPALVKEVPGEIGFMKSQELSNSLEALVALEEHLHIANLPSMVAAGGNRLKGILSEVRGKDFSFMVPTVLWAFAKTETYDGELFGAVAERLSSEKPMTSLPDWGVCAMALAYRALDQKGTFRDLLIRLESEICKRGLQEEEVLATRG